MNHANRITLLLACLALFGMPVPVWAKTPGEVAIGEALRTPAMQGLNSPSKSFAEFRGRPLVINVWASWCGPCREEMASLERLARMPKARDFKVIGISTDDYPDRAKTFLKYAAVTFDNYIDKNLVLENMLGADRIPLTLLVDAQGHVVAKYYGAREWDSRESLETINKAFSTSKRH